MPLSTPKCHHPSGFASKRIAAVGWSAAVGILISIIKQHKTHQKRLNFTGIAGLPHDIRCHIRLNYRSIGHRAPWRSVSSGQALYQTWKCLPLWPPTNFAYSVSVQSSESIPSCGFWMPFTIGNSIHKSISNPAIPFTNYRCWASKRFMGLFLHFFDGVGRLQIQRKPGDWNQSVMQ